MASGVKVDDCIFKDFIEMKMRRSPKKVAVYKICDNDKVITLDNSKVILAKDCNDNFFQLLKDFFQPDQCSYFLVDIEYETLESKKQELLFIFWAPEGAKIKQKMLYASSKQQLKQCLPGVSKYLEMHEFADVTRENIAQKLAGGKGIVSVEGQKV